MNWWQTILSFVILYFIYKALSFIYIVLTGKRRRREVIMDSIMETIITVGFGKQIQMTNIHCEAIAAFIEENGGDVYPSGGDVNVALSDEDEADVNANFSYDSNCDRIMLTVHRAEDAKKEKEKRKDLEEAMRAAGLIA